MRDLQAAGDLSSQRFLSRTLDGPAELAQITFYAGKREFQVFTPQSTAQFNFVSRLKELSMGGREPFRNDGGVTIGQHRLVRRNGCGWDRHVFP
jgi:hypothetical protein